MKRFRLLLAVVLMTVTLLIFVFAGMASASKVPHCISHWHVASSATIFDSVNGTNLGTVSLLRNGCGKIRGDLHLTGYGVGVNVYLVDAKNKQISVYSKNTTSPDGTDVKTATYSHYGGIAVSAYGTISQIHGDSPTISFALTPSNSGF